MTGKRKKKSKKTVDATVEEPLEILDQVHPEDDSEEASEEVLKSVAGSLEMAGQAMEFFDSEEAAETSGDEEVMGSVTDEPDKTLDDEATVVSADGDTSDDETLGAVMEDDDQQELIAENESQENFVDQDQLISVLESLLFASDRPVAWGFLKQSLKAPIFEQKILKEDLRIWPAAMPRLLAE